MWFANGGGKAILYVSQHHFSLGLALCVSFRRSINKATEIILLHQTEVMIEAYWYSFFLFFFFWLMRIIIESSTVILMWMNKRTAQFFLPQLAINNTVYHIYALRVPSSVKCKSYNNVKYSEACSCIKIHCNTSVNLMNLNIRTVLTISCYNFKWKLKLQKRMKNYLYFFNGLEK